MVENVLGIKNWTNCMIAENPNRMIAPMMIKGFLVDAPSMHTSTKSTILVNVQSHAKSALIHAYAIAYAITPRLGNLGDIIA
jgi:hypothetical protein